MWRTFVLYQVMTDDKKTFQVEFSKVKSFS